MKSFTQRVTLKFAVLVTGTTIAVLVVGGWMLKRQTLRSFELMHSVEFLELKNLLSADMPLSSDEIARRIGQHVDRDAGLYFIQIHLESGEVVFRSSNLRYNLLRNLTGRAASETFALPGIGPVHLSEFENGPLHIQVASSLKPMNQLMRDYAEVAGALALCVSALSLGMGYAFSRIMLRPVRAIAATADRIRSDNLSERIPVPTGSDELASLTELLNQMFDRLQSSFEQMRRFSADASHELKTPLALIRLNAEKIRSHLAHDPEGNAALSDLLEEAARMIQTIDRLLLLAKSESGALLLNLCPYVVSALLQPLAEDAQALAEDRGAIFELTRDEVGTIRVDPELLRQLLLNLIANAVSVSSPGGRVTLESYSACSTWKFVLTDEGPGLPPDRLGRLFERFARFDANIPSGDTRPGHGLGLAICKSIAEVHGGTIRAENRTDRSGLRLTVELRVCR